VVSAVPGHPALPVVFLGLFVVFALLRAAHTRPVPRPEAAGEGSRVGQTADRLRLLGSAALAVLVTLYGFWHVFGLFPWLGNFHLPLPDPARWVAAVAAAASLAALHHVRRDLGDAFRVTLTLGADHELVTHGWYQRVRHPMYAALTAYFLTATLVSANGLLFGLGVLLSGLLRLRTGQEEQMLAAHFGEAYRRYQDRTGRYLPRFIPRTRTR